MHAKHDFSAPPYTTMEDVAAACLGDCAAGDGCATFASTTMEHFAAGVGCAIFAGLQRVSTVWLAIGTCWRNVAAGEVRPWRSEDFAAGVGCAIFAGWQRVSTVRLAIGTCWRNVAAGEVRPWRSVTTRSCHHVELV